MKILLPFLLLLSFLSCNSKTSNTGKDDVIQSQEQKIKELEERLNKLEEAKGTPVNKRKGDYTRTSTPPPETRKSYYSIGSTESEVLEIQGEPTSIDDLGSAKFYTYGLSSITFENGKLSSFSNLGKNLKIRVSSQSQSNK
jgi:hypothetical protein